MIPAVLFDVALIIITVRSLYVTYQLFNRSKKQWLDIAFHASIAIVTLSLLM